MRERMISFGVWCVVIAIGLPLFDSAPILVAAGKLMLFGVVPGRLRRDPDVS
jgi:hypothetical protein